jgi:hypothetical protein
MRRRKTEPASSSAWHTVSAAVVRILNIFGQLLAAHAVTIALRRLRPRAD